jgi:epoxyqueuosine reductase
MMTAEHEARTFGQKVRAYARELGFEAVGIARADVSLDRDIERYDAFVAAGMHGEMAWLAKHRDARARLDGEGILEGARSVVCLARRYARGEASGASTDTDTDTDTGGGSDAGAGVTATIARYARGRDYHGFLRARVRRVASFIRGLGTPERPAEARPICDDAPVLERAWAARAGLGFVGKNGLLIVPGVGSMVLLAEVVTSLYLEPDEPMTERCGSCRRCLDACPTQAFVAPFVLDPRRCVSYLTIEHPGAIAPDLRAQVGDHVFGCDDCQTVCPFNAGTSARSPLWDEDGDPFAPFERWALVDLVALLSLDDEGWAAMSNGSPLKRAGRAGIARNAAMALGNRGAREALPALRKAAAVHDDPAVRETAAWAVSRLVG